MATIKGELGIFPVSPDRKHPYFISGDLSSTKALIFIGGLFNGMSDVPYLPALSEALGTAGWKFAQFHWTSAYEGFGTSSLDTDVRELSALVAHLRENGATKVVIMGHSTGSQDVIHYLTARARGVTLAPVDGGIMQAPVSDREHFAIDASTASWTAALPRATELVKAGKGSEILEADLGLRMSAYRLWSLLSPSGEDDYFSSDLPIEADGVHAHPLSASFGKLASPALALFSSKDEYAHVADIPALLARWTQVASGSPGQLSTHIIEGATHAVDDASLHPLLTSAVIGWLGQSIQL